MPSTDTIPLSELIAHLREELSRALIEGKSETTKFEIQEIGLELSVAVTKKLDGKGGVNFGVVTFDASSAIDQVKTQKISLKLKPLTGGKNMLISDTAVKPPKP